MSIYSRMFLCKMRKPQSGTIHLTRAEFLKKIADYENHSKEWKYLGDKPAIVDFYADWYGPCKMVAPILEELSKEYAGKIYIYKVNVDKEPELARDFGIQSIPTIWFVPMKGEPQVNMGALSKEELGNLGLTQEEEADIVAFMKTLTDGYMKVHKSEKR